MGTDRQAKMLERVRALLAKANATPFEGEADTFRQKADEIMTAFAIEAWQVQQAQDGIDSRPKPIKRDVNMDWWYRRGDIDSQSAWRDIRECMNWMWQDIARHCRVVIVYQKQHYSSDGGYCPVIGLPSDLDYFDLLFTSLYLEMTKRMAPKPDPNRLSLVENIVLLKEAGYAWQRIYELILAAGIDTPHYRGHYVRMYKEYCEEHNRQRNTTNPKTYQRSFAQGFADRVGSRLRVMARASEGAYDAGHEAGSMALAVQDIRIVVREAMYDFFPDLKPHPKDCECDSCKAKRKPVKYTNDNRKTDWAARAAGEKAADEVDITASNADQRIGGRKELQR